MWYVVDEFGFVTGEGFKTEKEAKESCNVWKLLQFQSNGELNII